MVQHFLLDTRSTYQRIKDWVCGLFKNTHQQEKKRLLSSTEIHNRRNIFTFNKLQPKQPNHVQTVDSSRTFRKIRVFQSPTARVAGKNNC